MTNQDHNATSEIIVIEINGADLPAYYAGVPNQDSYDADHACQLLEEYNAAFEPVDQAETANFERKTNRKRGTHNPREASNIVSGNEDLIEAFEKKQFANVFREIKNRVRNDDYKIGFPEHIERFLRCFFYQSHTKDLDTLRKEFIPDHPSYTETLTRFVLFMVTAFTLIFSQKTGFGYGSYFHRIMLRAFPGANPKTDGYILSRAYHQLTHIGVFENLLSSNRKYVHSDTVRSGPLYLVPGPLLFQDLENGVINNKFLKMDDENISFCSPKFRKHFESVRKSLKNKGIVSEEDSQTLTAVHLKLALKHRDNFHEAHTKQRRKHDGLIVTTKIHKFAKNVALISSDMGDFRNHIFIEARKYCGPFADEKVLKAWYVRILKLMGFSVLNKETYNKFIDDKLREIYRSHSPPAQ